MSESNAGASAPIATTQASTTEAPTSTEASLEASPEELAELSSEESSEQKSEDKALEKALKKLKIKVDGKEEDIELDLNNEEELKKHLQLSKAAQRRMQEAAESRKQIEQMRKDIQEFIQMLKEDPASILSDPSIGLDMKEYAQKYLEQQQMEEAKSPEQKEKEMLQKRLQELEQERAKEKSERERVELEKLQKEIEIEVEQDILGAIKKGDLPENPYVIRKMADMMILATQNGVNVKASDVAPIVKKQLLEEIKQMLGILPEDVIEGILGKDKIASLRKRQLKTIRDTTEKKIVNTGADVKSAQKIEEKIKAKDFFKKIGSF